MRMITTDASLIWHHENPVLEKFKDILLVVCHLMTGGGIVFGGGEPLLQSAFIHEICSQADPRWKKRIETSMNVLWNCVEPLFEGEN